MIADLLRDRARFQGWLDHVRTALDDVADIDTVEREQDRHRYLVIRYAKDEAGATDIVAGDRHPALQAWRRGQPDLGVLFAAGILS